MKRFLVCGGSPSTSGCANSSSQSDLPVIYIFIKKKSKNDKKFDLQFYQIFFRNRSELF